MPHPPRRAILALVPVLFVALTSTTAPAKVPDPRFTRVPAPIVGSVSGAMLPSCSGTGSTAAERIDGFRVETRDVNNSPLWFKPVTLDFSQSTIRLFADDTPGVTVDCAARTVTALTDQHGVVVFRPRFGGSSSGATILVTSDGVELRQIAARSTDVDGDGTTGLADFARVGRNFQDGSADPSTDFDPCAPGSEGRTTLSDFAIFARELVRSAQGTACP